MKREAGTWKQRTLKQSSGLWFLGSPGVLAGSGEARGRPTLGQGREVRQVGEKLTSWRREAARRLARASLGRGSYPGEKKLLEWGLALHEPGGDPEPRSDCKRWARTIETLRRNIESRWNISSHAGKGSSTREKRQIQRQRESGTPEVSK